MSVVDAAGTKLFETLLFCTLGPEEETEALTAKRCKCLLCRDAGSAVAQFHRVTQ